MRLPVRLLGVMAVLAGAAAVSAENWPQWRGPRGDGISKETLPAAFPEGGPKKIWSAKVGIGFACPIAVNGTVFAFGQDEKKEAVFAFNATDGKQLWTKSYDMGPVGDGGYDGTRATPLFDAGKVYTFGEAGQLSCWDAASGKMEWQTNVVAETKTESLKWGAASNPLLEGDRLYVQVGEEGPLVVGVNKNTGKIEWASQQKGQSSYAHPILVDVEGVKELVVFGGKAVYGIGVKDGKTLWEQPWKTDYDVNAATPLYRDGHLLVSSGYGHGAIMLKLTAKGAEKEWESRDMMSKFQGMILDGDYVYGNSAGKLKCLHWPDGKLVWTESVSLGEGGSIVKAGDKILALSERGKLYLLQADGETHKKLGEAPLFDEWNQIWTTPLLYEGKMYARGKENLVCYDLTGK